MRPKDQARGVAARQVLAEYHANIRPLPGLQASGATDSFVEQLIESLRRIEYIQRLHRQNHGPHRVDPASELFDPLMAASLLQRDGAIDEACWLVFLSVHFGKNNKAGWQLTRNVYGALGGTDRWSWARITTCLDEFAPWLHASGQALMPEGVVRFGNHRKYESIGPGPNGTAAVVQSYVRWVAEHGNHTGLFNDVLRIAAGNDHRGFDLLYRSMGSVHRFGRTARFDYLTMIGKLELAPIGPGIPYLAGATGPLQGARLLFGGRRNADLRARMLDNWVAELGAALGVNMQTMEDALCNWQKSPRRFVPFRG